MARPLGRKEELFLRLPIIRWVIANVAYAHCVWDNKKHGMIREAAKKVFS